MGSHIAGLGNSPSRVRLEHLDRRERNHSVPGNGAGAANVVGRLGAAVVRAAEELLQRASADARAHVDVTRDGRAAGVVPVRVHRGELAVDAGLDQVDPLRDGELGDRKDTGGASEAAWLARTPETARTVPAHTRSPYPSR